jgi:hypothetical protein
MSDKEKLLKARELAELLRLHPQTVYRWVPEGRFGGRDGRFKLVRVRGLLRFRKSDSK